MGSVILVTAKACAQPGSADGRLNARVSANELSHDGSVKALQVIKTRYRQWLLDDASTDYSLPLVRQQFDRAIERARRAQRLVAQIDWNAKTRLYDTRKPPVMPVQLTLNGSWSLEGDCNAVRLQHDEKRTQLDVECSDARSIEFVMCEK